MKRLLWLFAISLTLVSCNKEFKPVHAYGYALFTPTIKPNGNYPNAYGTYGNVKSIKTSVFLNDDSNEPHAELQWFSIEKFDKSQRSTQIVWYHDNGASYDSISASYEGTSLSYTSSKHLMSSDYIYSYSLNELGFAVQKTIQTRDKKTSEVLTRGTETLTYDTQGLLANIISDIDNQVSRITLHYDSDTIIFTYYRDDELVSNEVCCISKNDNGLVTDITIKDDVSNKITSIKFSDFDKHGNWRKVIEISDYGNCTYARDIEYY